MPDIQKLLVISDLDACFMNDDYSYSDALEAVEALKAEGFPLVFNSSKTIPELTALIDELQLDTPLVSENGGIVAVPAQSPLAQLCKSAKDGTWTKHQDYWTTQTGLDRGIILQHAHALRSAFDYQFDGFADWTPTELAAVTGLSKHQAVMAKDRHVSEPILWNDTPQHWEDFYQQLEPHGIRALHGGRFIHLMGNADKSDGLKTVCDLYHMSEPHTLWTCLALGDSPNDLSMLEAADIGVIIPHDKGPRIPLNAPHIQYASYPASKGWNQAVLDILK
ncbi:HAD-IIB family hydrolase [Verrucomicrobiaceae bacterium N1E253]|uniref:HAD-IIB family hydrolase n=1 Tax=Oceaniferula marina TaxID=2748318 RepID=A0A851GFT2_9BACT|nr:HAD-IIB family hydrolase [Oceaniferula marina]NWK54027.1 HAD-IIB family hydrolase [Oceaniferula marina]